MKYKFFILVIFSIWSLNASCQENDTTQHDMDDFDIYIKAMFDIISNNFDHYDSVLVIDVHQTYHNITTGGSYGYNPEFPVDSYQVAKRIKELNERRGDSIVFKTRLDTLYVVRDTIKYDYHRPDYFRTTYSKRHHRIRSVKSIYCTGKFKYDKLTHKLQKIEFKFDSKYYNYSHEGTIIKVEFDYNKNELDRIRFYHSSSSYDLYIIEYY